MFVFNHVVSFSVDVLMVGLTFNEDRLKHKAETNVNILKS
jgi:hypothetical protein